MHTTVVALMALGPVSPARRASAVVLTVVAASLGALILGEYELAGFTPYVGGVLFGLVMAEVMLSIVRRPDIPLAAVTGLASALGMVWAGWISTNHWRAPVPVGAWVGAAIAGGVGFGWVRWSARRGASSPADPPAGA